jgi:hypothetical protein
MVVATPAPRSRKSTGGRAAPQNSAGNPRIERFNGQALGAGVPFVAEEWAYRQAPAWCMRA